MENQEFPKGVGFAPFLRSFMSNSSISIDELAVAMTMSKYAITRLAEGKSYPTDVCYAEFCIMFTVVLGKDFDAYKKMTRKDKDDLVAKIMASGGSACTVAGMISLISASGVVAGLSAAGIIGCNWRYNRRWYAGRDCSCCGCPIGSRGHIVFSL